MNNVPSKDQIVAWLRDNPGKTAKRDLARAFGVKGDARVELKRTLKELEADGLITKGPRRSYTRPGELPPVTVFTVGGPDEDGDLFAEPAQWDEEQGPKPRLPLVERENDTALGARDRVLARVLGEGENRTAKVIRKLAAGPETILGIYRAGREAGRIEPVDKRATTEFIVPPGERNGARDGDLVSAERSGPKSRMGLPRARILERLGDPLAPKSVSLIAVHEHGIPDAFPDAAVKAAMRARPADLAGREDLRHLPLITIDPADARDHDDAVCAMPDEDPENPGGHIVWVAIADVAHYVRPNSPLDREARRRGNSSYFPDRVVPMLPDQLSGDLCSLHDDVERACIALRMRFDATGTKTGHDFHRGIMLSRASLTYQQAQAAIDGDPEPEAAPHLDHILKPLWAAYACALKGRAERAPLALDLPERRIELGEDGRVTSVAFRDRLDAHKLIEEFMVQANVCAAETLERKRQALIFRIHEEPGQDKIDALREIVRAAGFGMTKGQVLRTSEFNRLLDEAAGSEQAELINLSVLRSMTQAYYGTDNMGHFGLNLARYAHFTSPIRRYADLIVHRALVTAHGWGDDGLTAEDAAELGETAEHISKTERRSMLAERDTTDRYLAAYLSERIGQSFDGKISGIARFGLFVKLDETGADGLIPIRRLGGEYFRHDPDSQTLVGERSGTVFSLGLRVRVKIEEAAPITGGLLLELLEVEGSAAARPKRRPGGAKKPPAAKKGVRRNKSRRNSAR